jgi:hypothetical protein
MPRLLVTGKRSYIADKVNRCNNYVTLWRH